MGDIVVTLDQFESFDRSPWTLFLSSSSFAPILVDHFCFCSLSCIICVFHWDEIE